MIDKGIHPVFKLRYSQGHDLFNWKRWKSSELTRNQTEAKRKSHVFYG